VGGGFDGWIDVLWSGGSLTFDGELMGAQEIQLLPTSFGSSSGIK
jgi:hypothetical protein